MTAQADVSPPDVFPIFRETGAYLRGHFLLSSGLHSPEYLQCALVLQHPDHAEWLGRALAEKVKALAGGASVTLTMAPAMGGLIIGHEVARALGTPFQFTERDPAGRMTLRRGFSVTPGARVVVVEDVVTTGGSTREVIAIAREAGAEVVAAGSIIDRSGGTADVGAPRVALHTMKALTYPPDDCPLCRAGTAAVKPGSRK